MCCVGEANPQNAFQSYFGQTFLARGNTATNLTFSVGSNASEYTPGPFNFRTLILDIGNSNTISNAKIMFESDAISVAQTELTPISLDLNNLAFVEGHRYAWAIDTVSMRDGIADLGFFGVGDPIYTTDPDAYVDGRLFYLIATESGRDADLAYTWTPGESSWAMAFDMTFAKAEVSEPAPIALLAAGLAGLGFVRRRAS